LKVGFELYFWHAGAGTILIAGVGAFAGGCRGIFGSIFASPWATVMPQTTVERGFSSFGGSGTN
jgi:hypothetical protein